MMPTRSGSTRPQPVITIGRAERRRGKCADCGSFRYLKGRHCEVCRTRDGRPQPERYTESRARAEVVRVRSDGGTTSDEDSEFGTCELREGETRDDTHAAINQAMLSEHDLLDDEEDGGSA